jgi:uncharacterized protein
MEALSLLIKPVSGSCNLRCRYCFYADVTDARTVKNHGIMSFETLETIVKKALFEAKKYCGFAFQGGEPALAGLEFFKKLIELENKHNVNSVQIAHAIQTNGLLLDDAWAEFFRENNFLVGLSIDASKQNHDYFRHDTKEKGTHNRCMNIARMLTKQRVDFNILSVVTRQLANHPDATYNFYKKNDFRFIQFIPCLDDLSSLKENPPKINEYSLTPEIYGKFLCRIFDMWYSDFVKDDYYSIRAFDNYINMLTGVPPENCAMNGICNVYALIEADGSVYPCDFYATDEYHIGNVKTHSFGEMLGCEEVRAFIEPSQKVDPACKVCEYYFICRGGCRRDREPISDGVLSLNRYCSAYKQFFAHSLHRMKALAHNMYGLK